MYKHLLLSLFLTSVLAFHEPQNAGTPWLQEEDAYLAEEIQKGVPIHTIAATHQRTPLAITQRVMNVLYEKGVLHELRVPIKTAQKRRAISRHFEADTDNGLFFLKDKTPSMEIHPLDEIIDHYARGEYLPYIHFIDSELRTRVPELQSSRRREYYVNRRFLETFADILVMIDDPSV